MVYQMQKSLNNIITIGKLYLLSITTFTFFRIILLFTNLDKVPEVDGTISISNLVQSFIMGVRFDIVISGYFLILPFIALSVLYIIKKTNHLVTNILLWFLVFLYLISFIIASADIPFFLQFFTRININALQWADSPIFVIKMIIQEPAYYLAVIPLGIAIFVYYKALKIILNQFNNNNKQYPNLLIRIVVTLLGLVLIFIGIRGRLEEKSPIRIGTAYFCNNAFLNQLGLNPVFVFMRSALDKNKKSNQDINLINNEIALNNVLNYLNINSKNPNNPLLRYIKPDSLSMNKPNVILVIMESMSAENLKRNGNRDGLTLFLDSLANNSIYFDNIYTAGIHTHNGIFSSLFSYPAIMYKHSMRESEMLQYNGIAYTLKQLGYSTTFYTTHDGQFDNTEGFLRNNSFDRIYSQSDYPSDKVLSTLGVPDDYLFDYVINNIDNNKKKDSKKPFFVAMMTGSNHGPYIIPNYYKSKQKDTKKKVIEYADWSISKLINTASKKTWFENTIFIFVADHGAVIDPVYEMPISYHHTPLIYYAPKLLSTNIVYKQFGGQIDLFPTLMGLLKLPYFNNTLGVDLIKEPRPYMYFSSDDKYAVISDSLYLIVSSDGTKALFKYLTKDTKNYFNEYKSLANDMLIYAQSNIQTAFYLSKKNLQFKK